MPSHLSSSGSGGAGSYTLPVASASVLGGVKVGSGLAIDGSGALSAPPLGAVLYDQRLASAAPSFDVSSLDQSWRHLRLELVARSTAAVSNTHVLVQFNGDSAANYDDEQLYAYSTGSGVGAGEDIAVGSGYCGLAAGASAPAGVADATTMTILDYAGAVWRKQWLSLAAVVAADATGSILTEQIIGQWRNTAALTSLHLTLASGNFAAGSRLTVYGY